MTARELPELPESSVWISTGLRGLEPWQPSHVFGISESEANDGVTCKGGPGWSVWTTDPYYTADQMHQYALDAIEKAAPRVSEGFYLATYKRGLAGGCVVWWRPGDAGYTTNIDEAGIYTEIIPGYHDSDNVIPVPVKVVRDFRIKRSLDVEFAGNGVFATKERLRAYLIAAQAALAQRGKE